MSDVEGKVARVSDERVGKRTSFEIRFPPSSTANLLASSRRRKKAVTRARGRNDFSQSYKLPVINKKSRMMEHITRLSKWLRSVTPGQAWQVLAHRLPM